VFGNKEGAEKGLYSTKKGKKVQYANGFICEIKLLYFTWFKIGTLDTFDGIVEFLKE
jgi:hypothetical protein